MIKLSTKAREFLLQALPDHLSIPNSTISLLLIHIYVKKSIGKTFFFDRVKTESYRVDHILLIIIKHSKASRYLKFAC